MMNSIINLNGKAIKNDFDIFQTPPFTDHLQQYISLEIVDDTRRTSVGLLDEITDKFTFTSFLKEENINHQEFVDLVLQIIGIFEDSRSISKVRSTFTSKCDKPFKEEYSEKGRPIKRMCVLIMFYRERLKIIKQAYYCR